MAGERSPSHSLTGRASQLAVPSADASSPGPSKVKPVLSAAPLPSRRVITSAPMREGDLLWEPTGPSKMGAYMAARGFSSYDELWRWSVEDLEGFWGSIWNEYGLGPRGGPALERDAMPGAVWFPDARLNYAEYLPRMGRPGANGIVSAAESGP